MLHDQIAWFTFISWFFQFFLVISFFFYLFTRIIIIILIKYLHELFYFYLKKFMKEKHWKVRISI
jgi:hypothetical protein